MYVTMEMLGSEIGRLFCTKLVAKMYILSTFTQ